MKTITRYVVEYRNAAPFEEVGSVGFGTAEEAKKYVRHMRLCNRILGIKCEMCQIVEVKREVKDEH